MQEKTKYQLVFLLCFFTMGLANAQLLATYPNYNLTDNNIRYRIYHSNVSKAQFHTQEVIQDNELERNELGKDAFFDANPLLINGKQLDYGSFYIGSKGVLTLVKGKIESKEAMPIAFYVSIRRDGKILTDKKMSFMNKPLYKVNLSDIYPFSKDGDVLIVKPVRAEDWKGKRILKLLFDGC